MDKSPPKLTLTGGLGRPLGSVSLLPLVGVVATAAGGGGRLRERVFADVEEGEGAMWVELLGEVKEEVLGRGWAEGEVKEEARGREGWEEGEGERGEVKEKCGEGLLPGGEKRPTGGVFVLGGREERVENNKEKSFKIEEKIHRSWCQIFYNRITPEKI